MYRPNPYADLWRSAASTRMGVRVSQGGERRAQRRCERASPGDGRSKRAGPGGWGF